MRRVILDRHHADLFHAMQVLLEDRLGYLVYAPVGPDWWTEGYWRFGEGYGDDRLAQQFLSTDGWRVTNPEQSPGFRNYEWTDPHHPQRKIRGVELGAVKATSHEWAYIVASVQDNQRGFKRLADELRESNAGLAGGFPKDRPAYVLQVGNTNQYVDWTLDPLAIVSSEVPIQGRGVLIHQPMPAAFRFYRDPEPSKVIRSFVNCFNSTPCIEPFVTAGVLLPEFTFCTHGIDGSDGNVETVAEIADLMAGSAFGWHDKVQGDGFGHVIHDWAAIGRPVIGHASHYRGLMAERFWQDGVTCIDLDQHPISEVAQIIATMDRKTHRKMCQAIRAEFDAIDWDGETEAVRGLLA